MFLQTDMQPFDFDIETNVTEFDGPATEPDLIKLRNVFRRGLESSKLDDSQKKDYALRLHKAVNLMSPTAIGHLASHMTGVHFHPSIEHLGNHLYSEMPSFKDEMERRGMTPVGVWDHQKGHLHFDGPLPEDKNGLEVLMHELGHAVDHKHKFSNMGDWKEAWVRDIVGVPKDAFSMSSLVKGLFSKEKVPLTKYAKENEHEGFAEFSRMLHFNKPELVRNKYPLASAFWDKHGLMPKGTESTNPIVDVFHHPHTTADGMHTDNIKKKNTQLDPNRINSHYTTAEFSIKELMDDSVVDLSDFAHTFRPGQPIKADEEYIKLGTTEKAHAFTESANNLTDLLIGKHRSDHDLPTFYGDPVANSTPEKEDMNNKLAILAKASGGAFWPSLGSMRAYEDIGSEDRLKPIELAKYHSNAASNHRRARDIHEELINLFPEMTQQHLEAADLHHKAGMFHRSMHHKIMRYGPENWPGNPVRLPQVITPPDPHDKDEIRLSPKGWASLDNNSDREVSIPDLLGEEVDFARPKGLNKNDEEIIKQWVKRLDEHADIVEPEKGYGYHDKLRMFHEAISKLPDYKGLVHRSYADLEPEPQYENLKEGSIYTLYRPKSSSTDPKIADTFHQDFGHDFGDGTKDYFYDGQPIHIMHLNTKSGKYIGGLNKFRQKEVILTPGSRFKITKREEGEGRHYGPLIHLYGDEIEKDPKIEKKFLKHLAAKSPSWIFGNYRNDFSDFAKEDVERIISKLHSKFRKETRTTEMKKMVMEGIENAVDQITGQLFGKDIPKEAKQVITEYVSQQRAYLYNYAKQVKAEEAEIVPSRTMQYASSLHGLFETLKNLKSQQSGKTMERRVLGDTDANCKDCVRLAKLGWKKIGTLARIGSTQCKANCRCFFEYR